MLEKLKDLLKGFNTIPFLFIGSGITRRYYGLPNWENLLKTFASRISDDEYVYNSYANKAQDIEDLPQIATLIEDDFNLKWFDDKKFRQLNDYYSEFVRKGTSPFKAEVAYYLYNNSMIQTGYESEIEKFKKLTEKSISGIITTNYDCFLENHTDGYKKYIGQEELVSSNIQGIAEIYKIHGCVTDPNSIIINKDDYNDFKVKSTYLAAKLMTIFLEYPIVFIGYSLADDNIQNILNSIAGCLSTENLRRLENRFIFVEYSETNENIVIASHTKEIGGKHIPMTKVTLKNFSPLYDLLSEKKPSIPVKILRVLRDEIYNYTITNEPTAHLKVAFIDDERINDDDYAIAIGKISEIAGIGLKGINSNNWYRNIILEDLPCTADDLLEITYGEIIKSANKLPLNKYLSMAKNQHDYLENIAREENFDKIISTTIKGDRDRLKIRRNVMAIWDDETLDLTKKTYYIAHLTENQIIIDDLEKILIEVFHNDPDILIIKDKKDSNYQRLVSNIKRLIRIYDYIKYNKVRERLD